ncbi:unnamed protein product [Gadus morhua 'NCC']
MLTPPPPGSNPKRSRAYPSSSSSSSFCVAPPPADPRLTSGAASADYDKSRSLTNVSGGSSLRLAPISSPSYEPPGPLHRCRSPIPSIL